MEQKKVQRIIGILVVIALVIIVMPLLFGKNNFPVQEAANIKAPPFPDQQPVTDAQKPVVASATDTSQEPNTLQQNTVAPASSTSDATTVAATPSDKMADNAQLPEPPVLSTQIEKASTENQSIEKQSVEVAPEIVKKVNADSVTPATTTAATDSPSIPDNKPAPAVGSIIYEPASVSTAPTPAAPDVNQKPVEPATVKKTPSSIIITDTLIKTSDDSVETTPKPDYQVIKNIVKVKNKQTKSITTPHTNVHAKAKIHPLNKENSSAWVVQMGNFAVKKNAIHFANVLQAAGYKAFTKEVKTKSGNVYTRVYIGPEFKQASATQVSKEVNTKLSFQGFVIPYAKA